MNAKLTIAALALLGVPVLLVSAPAQQPRLIPDNPGSSTDSDLDKGLPIHVTPKPTTTPPGLKMNKLFRGPGVSIPDGQYDTFVINPLTSDEDSSLAQWVNELSRKLGEVKSDSEKSEIKNQLQQALEKQFNLRQKRHHDEIAELEAKVKKLKDLVEKRQENRREIIAKRLEQILRDAEGLGW